MRTSRWPISHLPISDITPFTYRDGETYLELLNRLSQYITEQLHPNLRKTVEHMVEEMEHILAAQHGKYVEGIQDFQRIHDAFMTDVNSALMALNDSAVTDLVNDPGSLLGGVLAETYERRSRNNTKNYQGSAHQRLEQALADVGVVQFDETFTHTGNIAGFWDTSIYGTGVIELPGGGAFTPDPHPSPEQQITNTLYVNAQTGDDHQDGLTPSTAMKSVMGVYHNVLRRLTAQQAAGAQWVIRLSGQFTTSHRFSQLPDFPQGLIFEGDPQVNGFNQTRFTYSGSDSHICFWIEPGAEWVEFKNIHFQGYASPTTLRNGYSVLMKLGGRLLVNNCSSENSDTAFAAIQNVNFSIHDNDVRGGVWGVKAQYNSSGAFNRNTIRDVSNYGVHVTRNTVAHFDYNTVENSGIAAAQAEMASRMALVGNTLRSNPVGVLVQGAAEWINNDNIFIDNDVNYRHNGVGRENRMHSQGLGNAAEFRIHSTLAAAGYLNGSSVHHPGGSSRVTVFAGASSGRIPAEWFDEPQKRLRFEVYGTIESSGSHGATIDIGGTNRDGSGFSSVAVSPLPGSLDGDFFVEVFVHPESITRQHRFRKTIAGSDIFTSSGYGSVDFSDEQTLRLTVRGRDGGAPFTANIRYMHVYAIG